MLTNPTSFAEFLGRQNLVSCQYRTFGLGRLVRIARFLNQRSGIPEVAPDALSGKVSDSAQHCRSK